MVVTPRVTETEPEVALPVEKLVPAQDVAFVEDHVRVEEPPAETEVGEALRVAVGAGVEQLPPQQNRSMYSLQPEL